MKKIFLLSIAIAVSAAFFASTNPDGLDFAAEKFGFAGKGIERTALIAPHGSIPTAFAGIAGVIIILILFWASAYALKRASRT